MATGSLAAVPAPATAAAIPELIAPPGNDTADSASPAATAATLAPRQLALPSNVLPLQLDSLGLTGRHSVAAAPDRPRNHAWPQSQLERGSHLGLSVVALASWLAGWLSHSLARRALLLPPLARCGALTLDTCDRCEALFEPQAEENALE